MLLNDIQNMFDPHFGHTPKQLCFSIGACEKLVHSFMCYKKHYHITSTLNALLLTDIMVYANVYYYVFIYLH